MREIAIDLREVKLLMRIEEVLHVEGRPGGFTIHSVGLPKGTYEVALLLAVAGFERFIFDLFVEAAKVRLKLNAHEATRYRENIKRLLANPSPEVIERAFGYIGIFDVFDKNCKTDQEFRSHLGRLITERHRVAHGKAVERFDEEPLGTWSQDLFTPDPRDRKEAISELIAFFESSANQLNQSILARLQQA